jgi:hypothetical protein
MDKKLGAALSEQSHCQTIIATALRLETLCTKLVLPPWLSLVKGFSVYFNIHSTSNAFWLISCGVHSELKCISYTKQSTVKQQIKYRTWELYLNLIKSKVLTVQWNFLHTRCEVYITLTQSPESHLTCWDTPHKDEVDLVKSLWLWRLIILVDILTKQKELNPLLQGEKHVNIRGRQNCTNTTLSYGQEDTFNLEYEALLCILHFWIIPAF